MTTADTTDGRGYLPVPVRFEFQALAPAVTAAVRALRKAADDELASAGVDQGLIELIRLRASQLNGCAYCVGKHTAGAREAGVSGQRIDLLPVWADSPVYTAGERAAFALTESVTRLSETHAPEVVVNHALTVLGPKRTAAVLGLIVSVSAWNQIGVTSHCWPVAVRDD